MGGAAPLANGAKLLSAAATGLADLIQARHLCLDSILGSAGLDPANLADPVAQLNLDSYCNVLDLAAQRSGDENFGLLYGQQFQPSQLGLIGYIALSSDNALHAAESTAAYFKFHQQETSTQLYFYDPFYYLTYCIEDARIRRREQDAVLTLGMFCNIFRHASGADWCPDEIHLAHSRTENWRSIELAFGAPVRFDCRMNALLFRPERAVGPMPQRDPNLLQLLCHNLKTVGLGRTGSPITASVGSYIRDNIASGRASLEDAGSVMRISSRMLQRRLADEGATFADLVEKTRKIEARRTLLEGNLDVSQIAYELGYSEPSAFVRAFNRWYGVSPLKFRKMHKI